ncbi:MAG: hypothetical protein KDB40_24300 [Acidimicrobiales bacterium]|nr:hypothetical protein [Acidimicrobiales bacterium]MCB9395351.1 hypothetical protein [Acidimicrobiaceae bacterium]
MRRRGRVARVAITAFAAITALGGCSDDEAGPTEATEATDAGSTDAGSAVPVSTAPGADACAPVDPVLLVDRIDEAVAAVEAELGGPQQYFEINATATLVNLFVADVAAESVTPYAYVGDELSSDEPIVGATGNTFAADAVAVDTSRVLGCVSAELPDTALDVFFVEGGAGGTVRYTVLGTSAQGGQLVVEVAATGQIIGVDAI